MELLWEILKYTFLGLIQGFTEPIPISSSGHLVMAQSWLGLKIEGLSFEVFVNFASLLAVLLIYRQDLIRLVVRSWSYVTKRDQAGRSDFMFVSYLVLATIPAAVIGVLLEDVIAKQFKDHVKMIGISLLITGIALWLIKNLSGKKNDHHLSWKDALIVGFAQAVALIPGISRSGATIVAALALGMKQETALRFSFLLYIPISLGTMLLAAGDIAVDPHLNELWLPYIFAFIASLLASYFSLRWFMNIMQNGKLIWFAYYCFIVGTIALIFL